MMSPAEHIGVLFREHGRFVFRVVRRLGAPARDVEDLTQEVFMIAFRKMHTFDGCAPRGWLFRIASRVVAGERRRARTTREKLDESMPEERTQSSEGQEALVWNEQLRTALDAALDTLNQAERELFLLYELEGLSMRKCADIVGCPEQTGYSRLKVARRKMRSHLCAQSELATVLSLKQVG